MRVVFVVLDGLPVRHVGPRVTPVLARLAAEGGSAVGRAVMTSATYPNHATFATGVAPRDHGLVANWVVADGRPRPADAVGVRVPAMFDQRAVAVVGDQHLVGVMGLTEAATHWPRDGALPDGVALDAHGYAADAAVLAALSPLIGGDGLVFLQLNEPDTAGHVFGPDSEAAVDAYRSTDAAVGTLVEWLRPGWADTVLIVVSDHDMEGVGPEDPIDLWAAVSRAGLDLLPIPEGSGTVVWGEDPTDGAWLDAVPGVAGHEAIWPNARLAWAEPGRWFAPPAGYDRGPPEPGTHGGAFTRDQVAVVAGGHPAVAELAATIARRPPPATFWAPTIRALLNA
jgi:hypothetical protein